MEMNYFAVFKILYQQILIKKLVVINRALYKNKRSQRKNQTSLARERLSRLKVTQQKTR